MWRRVLLLLLLLVVVVVVTCFSTLACPVVGLQRDILQVPLPVTSTGLHVVMQTPWGPSVRKQEFHDALLATLRHPHVRLVHLMAESVPHQIALYQDVVPADLHDKLRTYNINKRISYADAVRYANTYLQNTTAILCNADVSIVGENWAQLTQAELAPYLFGLTRHEQPGCAMQCDCGRKFGGCHDCFAFVPPLSGGDALLESISFRMGGLWGAENRFMWEVAKFNPGLRVTNPCHTFRTLHWHCVDQGRYRPTQDQRRINGEGMSLEPWPSRWQH